MPNAKSSANSLYEGMFLFPQSFGTNLLAAADEVKAILGKVDADIVLLAKWDERRLAFPIQGEKRGIYLITYFYCAGPSIASIERDSNLSETILRAMCIKANHMGETELELAKKEYVEITAEAAIRGELDGGSSEDAAPADAPAEAAAPAADSPAESTDAPEAEKTEEPTVTADA